MKLKKLTIENIASIEKAEIDFEKAPLSDESLFLIFGETGSGKTTILDAICLALYGKTPRYTGEKVKDASEVGNLKFYDVRQVVRHGATSACARLTFQGNDGLGYTAEWSVKAIGSKTNKGQLKNAEHHWKRGNPEIEINPKIARPEAIGLEFEQYCRTSMLAQGDFTTFLCAKDEKKIEILEKLTDTTRYAKIGQQVAEITKGKVAYVNTLKDQLKVFPGLLAEERQEIEKEQKDKEEEKEARENVRKSLEEKKKWMEDWDKLNTRKEADEQALRDAENVLKTEAFQTKQRIVQDWDTAQAEQVLEAYRQWKRAENDLVSCAEQLRKLETTFIRLMRGKKALDAQCEKDASALKEVANHLSLAKDNANLYENAAVVLSALKDAREALAKASGHAQQEKDLVAKSHEVENEVSKAKFAKDAADTDVTQKEGEIASKEQEIADLNLPQVRTEITNLEARGLNLDALKTSVEKASTEEEAIGEESNALNAEKNALTQEREQLPSLKTAWGNAQEATRNAKEKRDKDLQLLKNGLEKIVHSLKIGDECPICGNTIQKLQTNEYFAELRKSRDDEVRAAEEFEKAKKAAHDKAHLDVTEKETAIKQKEEALARRKTDLKNVKSDNERKASELGLSELTEAAIDGAIASANAQKASLKEITEKGNSLEKELNELRKQLKAFQKTQKSRSDALGKAEKTHENHKNAIAQAQRDQRREKQTAADKLDSVRGYMPDSSWEMSWHEAAEAFETNLRDKAREYSEWKTQQIALTQSVRELESQKSRVKADMDTILFNEPSWKECYPEDAEDVTDLEESVGKLLNDVTTLDTTRADKEAQTEYGRNKCHEFLASHEGWSESRLAELATLNVTSLRAEVDKQLTNVTTCRANVDTTQKDRDAHEAKRPQELADSDTKESLEEQLNACNASLETLTSDIAVLSEQLRADNENANERDRIQKDLVAAQAELDDWNPLNTKFGDTTGKKVQGCIQKYVLRNVLQKANRCLKQLAKRYELSCEGLTLTVLDSQEGGVERPVDTLSGGERFLVSLALALGLAGMNEQGLAVDTLFIDEGFGTLSAEYLNMAIEALEKVNTISGCRKVGVISHVERLRERIKTHIEVSRKGSNPSVVSIHG